jgi:hypothetical protein
MDWPGNEPGHPCVRLNDPKSTESLIVKLVFILRKRVTVFLNASYRLLFEMEM